MQNLVFFAGWILGLPGNHLPTDVDPPALSATVQIRYTRLAVLGGCGVRVGRRHVLTAGHAVDRWHARQLCIQIGGERFAVQSVVRHPSPKIDLALVQTARPMPVKTGTAILGRSVPDVDAIVQLGGYGISGTLESLRLPGTFTRGQNRVTRVDPLRLRMRLDAPDDPASVENEAFPSTMDSGSGVWANDTRKMSLVAITVSVSRRDRPNVGDHSHHHRIDAVADWINQHVPDAQWSDGSPDPAG